MTDKSTITCIGRCDGMGDLDPRGSYVRVIYRVPGIAEHYIKLSEGAAAQLADELNGTIGRVEKWRRMDSAPRDGSEFLWTTVSPLGKRTVCVIKYPEFIECFDEGHWKPLSEIPGFASLHREAISERPGRAAVTSNPVVSNTQEEGT